MEDAAPQSVVGKGKSPQAPIVQPILSCLGCRKRKTACNKVLPECSRCLLVGQSCEYESLPKRKRKSPACPKQSGTIEDRLASIEACLQGSGMLPKRSSLLVETSNTASTSNDRRDNNTSMDLEPTRLSAHVSNERRPAQPMFESSLDHVEGATNPLVGSALQVEATVRACEPHVYWPRIAERLGGPLADLLFPRGVYCVTRLGEPVMDFRSPQGLRWLSEKSTPNCAREIVQTLVSCAGSDNEPASCFTNMSMNPPVSIPPEGETLNILNTYFKYCNAIYPLYDELSFRSLIQEQFHGRPLRGIAWYASLNVTLCLGMRALDAMGLRGIDMAKDRRPSDYFENAMRHSSELLMDNPSIFGAGALIGLAIYLQTTENVDPSFSLLSIALRQVRQLYLTMKNLPITSAQVRDCRQIRRLFWLAYSINNDTILQSGCPWVPTDSELDFEFTESDMVDEPTADGDRPSLAKYAVFSARVKLALIQSMIYRELYTTSVRQKPLAEVSGRIKRLDAALREWQSTVLEVVRPPGSIMLQPALLGLRYHSTIMMDEYTANSDTQSSVHACVGAARATIGILRSLPNRTCKYALNQLVMKSALASFATVFSNVLANPEDQETSNDIDLMNFVVEIVHSFKQHGGFAKVANQLLMVCEVMTRVARELVRARRRRRPMLDYPSASRLTALEPLDGPLNVPFDWKTMISAPPMSSLEEFLSVAPDVGDKTPLDALTENLDTQIYDTAYSEQVPASLPLGFQETFTANTSSTGVSLWSFGDELQGPSLESHMDDLDSMDGRFPI